jgi:hypothetical protein
MLENPKIDCAEFKRTLRMIELSCQRAAIWIDDLDSTNARRECNRIEQLLIIARRANGENVR